MPTCTKLAAASYRQLELERWTHYFHAMICSQLLRDDLLIREEFPSEPAQLDRHLVAYKQALSNER